MKRFNYILLGLVSLALAGCMPEPAKRAVARGDHDSVRGAVWTAFLYETPYVRGSSSYEFVVLHDYGGLADNYKGSRSIDEVRQDFALEIIELGVGLCAGLRTGYQGVDIDDIGFPFVNFYIDCI